MGEIVLTANQSHLLTLPIMFCPASMENFFPEKVMILYSKINQTP